MTRILLLLLALLGCGASEDDWFVPLGAGPRAAPRRIAGGESFPPLPLPATPLRRSERKRQPSPPPLFGKLVWGASATFSVGEGSSTTISDWNLCPADLQGLMDKARRQLGVAYGSESVSLADFHGDPERLPALFVSGVRSFRLSDEQAARLRDYLRRGGMLVFDSVSGSPYFTASARAAAAAILPDRPLRQLDADHPLFRIAHVVDKAAFARNAPGDRPVLEGAWIGTRCAIVLSPAGLGCGWDDRVPAQPAEALAYDPATAACLGVNLVAYVLAYAQPGRAEAQPEGFAAEDLKPAANAFVFAQIRHGGHWDVHPGAAAALLARARRDTALAVNLRRSVVTPGKDDLAPFGTLWLSGVGDLRFDQAQTEALRGFLARGGTLIAINGLGMEAFDRAFRRELAAILPGATLAPVAPTHPLYSLAVPLTAVRYAPEVLRRRPGLSAPLLEAVQIDGDLRVIYSPFDCAAAWDGFERAGGACWDPASSSALGLDLLAYALTH